MYVGSTEQPMSYDQPTPYAQTIADLITSMRPDSVLEFGCNAGRNLDQLRRQLPGARLFGVDVNPTGIEQGRDLFGLELELADEAWLTRQPSISIRIRPDLSRHTAIPTSTTTVSNASGSWARIALRM
jgi:hypothetical protein